MCGMLCTPCGFHKKKHQQKQEFLLFAEGWVGRTVTGFFFWGGGSSVRPPKNAPVADGTN